MGDIFGGMLGKGGGGGGGGGGGRHTVNVYDQEGNIIGTRETDRPGITAFDNQGGFADENGVWHAGGAGGPESPGEGFAGPEIPPELFEFLNELTTSSRMAREMGQELFGLTRPLRTDTVDTLTRVLRGERPQNFRVFAPEREALESQFTNAREATISGSPARGGAMSNQLRDLEVARALGISSQEADVSRRGFAAALETGFGTPSTALSGVLGAGNLSGQGAGTLANVFGSQAGLAGSAFGTQADLFNASGNRALATLGLLGQLMGGSAGRSGSSEQAKKSNLTNIAQGVAKGACWVAAVLYGRGTPEWHAARRWMLAGRWRLAVYVATGPWVAWGATRSARLRWALRPYFDRAVWEGA